MKKIRRVALHRRTECQNDFLHFSSGNPLYQAVDLQITWTYPVHRRNNTAQDMINTAELPRVFDRHHFLDILDHADRRMITLAVDTDSTHVIVAYIMADLTIFDITTKCQQRGRKPFRCNRHHGEAYGAPA